MPAQAACQTDAERPVPGRRKHRAAIREIAARLALPSTSISARNPIRNVPRMFADQDPGVDLASPCRFPGCSFRAATRPWPRTGDHGSPIASDGRRTRKDESRSTTSSTRAAVPVPTVHPGRVSCEVDRPGLRTGLCSAPTTGCTAHFAGEWSFPIARIPRVRDRGDEGGQRPARLLSRSA